MPNEDRAITRLRSFHQRSRACSETPPCLECAPLGYDAFVSSSMYHRYISDSDSRLAFKAAHFGLGTRVSEHTLVFPRHFEIKIQIHEVPPYADHGGDNDAREKIIPVK